jgi:hypothetical protein
MTTKQESPSRYGTIGRPQWLRGWRGLALLATMAVAIGLGAGWHWLASVGALSLLVTALPCLAMCALGLCMHRTGGAKDRNVAVKETPDASFADDRTCCGEPTGTPAKQTAGEARRQDSGVAQ